MYVVQYDNKPAALLQSLFANKTVLSSRVCCPSSQCHDGCITIPASQPGHLLAYVPGDLLVCEPTQAARELMLKYEEQRNGENERVFARFNNCMWWEQLEVS